MVFISISEAMMQNSVSLSSLVLLNTVGKNLLPLKMATVRLRTAKTRGCVARHTILSMVYKLGQSAQKRWRRLRGFKLLAEIIRGVQFKDGERIEQVEKGELNRAVV